MNTSVPDSLHYCISLYWAVATLTSTGYGDYSATNTIEMIYSIFVMIFGKLMFGFILGSIASTLANLESQRVLFEDKLSSIKVFVLALCMHMYCNIFMRIHLLLCHVIFSLALHV